MRGVPRWLAVLAVAAIVAVLGAFTVRRALTPAAELPAQDLAERLRRHAVGIEEMGAVEMIRDGTGIGFHQGVPGGGDADRGSAPGEHSQNMTAGEFHGELGSKRQVQATWGGCPMPERQAFSASFLDFCVMWALNAATFRKELLFEPPTGP